MLYLYQRLFSISAGLSTTLFDWKLIEILNYIFYLGIALIVFNLIWVALMFVMRMAISGPIGENVEFWLLRPLNHYLLVSVAVLYTLSIPDTDITLNNPVAWIYAIVGGSAIFFFLTGKIKKSEIEFTVNNQTIRLDRRRKARRDTFFALCALLFFAIALFLPATVDNQLTEWFLATIESIYATPVIGWIIGFFGILFSLRLIFKGISLSTLLFQHVFFGPDKHVPGHPDEEYVDYEIVEEEDSDGYQLGSDSTEL